MEWTFIYLMFALKVPIVAAIWLVWWAVKQEPDPHTDERDNGCDGEDRAERVDEGRTRLLRD